MLDCDSTLLNPDTNINLAQASIRCCGSALHDPDPDTILAYASVDPDPETILAQASIRCRFAAPH